MPTPVVIIYSIQAAFVVSAVLAAVIAVVPRPLRHHLIVSTTGNFGRRLLQFSTLGTLLIITLRGVL